MTRDLRNGLFLSAIVMASTVHAAPGVQQLDSFRIGSAGVTCTAQHRSTDPQLKSMFDRAYAIVCQDAAAAVGKLYVVKGAARPLETLSGGASCDAAEALTQAGLTGGSRAICTAPDSGLRYVRYSYSQSGKAYFAEGLAGYDSALRLGLQSLVQNRQVPGSVEVAVTEAGDPAAFARVQAGNLDPDQALAEGYSRNNVGSFPEAAEFFDTLLDRARSGETAFSRTSEYAANRALQLSNLGRFEEAEPLFQAAEQNLDLADPVQIRLLRNFRMINALNRGDGAAAIAELTSTIGRRSIQMPDTGRLETGYLDRPIVQRLNTEDGRVAALGGSGGRLSSEERTALLDAQSRHLEGVAYRLIGDSAKARSAQLDALSRIAEVRNGKVMSASWLRAGALGELAAIAETRKDAASAQKLLEEAVLLYSVSYPGSPALTGARARLAVSLARGGKTAEARSLFRSAVDASLGNASASANVRTYLAEYFDLLTGPASDSNSVSDLFVASQLLVRPGLAQTQAVFARELSGGADEASRLFRYSINLSRDIVRLDGDIARLAQQSSDNGEAIVTLANAQAKRKLLETEQTALLSKLAEYPRFRAVSDGRVEITDLQAALGPDEAYYRMILAKDRLFALFVTRDSAKAYPLDINADVLAGRVAKIRDSIAITNSLGQTVTPEFEVGTARRLYLELFGPVAEQMAKLDHLIFEPDGAMLQLPVNLLVAEQAGVTAYFAQQKLPDADPYDLRGIAWLGRKQSVSVAVSTKGFIDIRRAANSRAERAYLGIGENAPLNEAQRARIDAIDCNWPSEVWGNPISADELRFAASKFASGNPELLLGEGFTDAALAARSDLRNFRILHFATHGLVSAPRPECPAQPALVSSFGAEGSDGLLSFRDVFDLQLDADLVLLSACDTAGAATVSATREAGLSTGGNFALDGLVRAFVAAGARSVVASYWPVPDDFDATKTLITGLLSAEPGVSVGSSLRQAQSGMMDNALTSHPFYWSAFGIIGDAQKALAQK